MQKITLSVKEISELLGISIGTVYSMARAEEIPHVKIRGRVLFYRPVIEEWLANGATQTKEQVEV